MTNLEKSNLDIEQLEDVQPKQQQKSGISVVARIRPALQNESKNNQFIYKLNNMVITQDPQNQLIKTSHPFDSVFGPEAQQDDIFQTIKTAIDDFLGGVPLLQINYGVTGSGKTYTLFGTQQNPGIIVNAVHHARDSLPNAKFFISVVQIYLNQVTDLLNANNQLKIFATQLDPLPGRKYQEITDDAVLQKTLAAATALRESGATMCNSQSSRSHCLIYLITQFQEQQNQCCFVDLAGSEPFQSGSSKQLQQESSFIRTSLLMLDKAIRDLRNLTNCNQNSVSFRSSQLTMCLRQFLQPKQNPQTNKFELPAQVCLILNLHGGKEQFHQNKETLNLGLLTKEIKNYAKTPSKLGILGHSVQQLLQSVTDSQVNNQKQMQKQVTIQNVEDSKLENVLNSVCGEEQLIIKKSEWELITNQFNELGDQLIQLQQEAEEELIQQRREATREVGDYYELEIQQIRAEYERELYEKDLEIIQLKKQLGQFK